MGNVIPCESAEEAKSQYAVNFLFPRAEDCFLQLQNKLGASQYFFGGQPTILDALVYSYVSIITCMDLPRDSLRTLLQKYPQLMNHSRLIGDLYYDTNGNIPEEFLKEARSFFSDSQSGYDEEKPKNASGEKSESEAAESDGFSSREMKIKTWMSFGVAAIAMTGYALSSGIVSFVDAEDDLNYDEEMD
eukprot:Sdes_comp20095_c0_seq2m13058